MNTQSIKRLKERVLECGGTVFFGDIALEEGEEYLGNTDMPVVTIDERVGAKIRAIKVNEQGEFHIIGEITCDYDGFVHPEYELGEIIDPLDVDRIDGEDIDYITDSIIMVEKTIWLCMGVTVKGTKKEIEEILENGADSGETLLNLIQSKKFEVDGETYIPASIILSLNKQL